MVQIEEDNGPDGPTLQVLTDDSDALIGRRGETLEDIQYLVNRVLQRHIKDAARVRVDVEFYRSMREDKMVARAKEPVSYTHLDVYKRQPSKTPAPRSIAPRNTTSTPELRPP